MQECLNQLTLKLFAFRDFLQKVLYDQLSCSKWNVKYINLYLFLIL